MIRLLVLLLLLAGCGRPSIEDLLPKGGIHCKAEITTPSGTIETTASISKSGVVTIHGPLSPRLLDKVNVDVRIYDCKAAP